MLTKNQKNTKNAAHNAVTQGNDVQNTIRNIVTQALEDGKMEPDAIKQTLNDVVEGACEGANINSQKNTAVLKEVIHGVDSALKQCFYCFKISH